MGEGIKVDEEVKEVEEVGEEDREELFSYRLILEGS